MSNYPFGLIAFTDNYNLRSVEKNTEPDQSAAPAGGRPMRPHHLAPPRAATVIKRPSVTTKPNNRMTASQDTIIYHRLNQIIITAETNRNKPCRSFAYLIVVVPVQ